MRGATFAFRSMLVSVKSPQCTQSVVPSVVRFTMEPVGTMLAVTLSDPAESLQMKPALKATIAAAVETPRCKHIRVWNLLNPFGRGVPIEVKFVTHAAV